MFYEPWEPGTPSTGRRRITPLPWRAVTAGITRDSVSWGELQGLQCAVLPGSSRGYLATGWGAEQGRGVGDRVGMWGGGQDRESGVWVRAGMWGGGQGWNVG